ncbi:DNA-binding CsgD family transcriptional regulator [Evansella vedderi]|uniref:DNA-binding CsgD family transcriptional regulator n=1 Tax=Evansella vedderi TaxID=38282 RepID=A0ABT9ZRT3_9BACI|nr:hypothetical protein [Evansella vedderi]MDQ0253938.1 DNA-binding CsgD family transcriptional regulator [Evansella vedderi]
MRKKINLQVDSQENKVADLWIQHLIQRIIVEQLDISPQLQANLLYKTMTKLKSKE